MTDARAAQPYRLGVELLAALSSQPGFAWRDGGAGLTWLVGTPELFAALARGDRVAEILARDAADHDAWRRRRAPFLLYD